MAEGIFKETCLIDSVLFSAHVHGCIDLSRGPSPQVHQLLDTYCRQREQTASADTLDHAAMLKWIDQTAEVIGCHATVTPVAVNTPEQMQQLITAGDVIVLLERAPGIEHTEYVFPPNGRYRDLSLRSVDQCGGPAAALAIIEQNIAPFNVITVTWDTDNIVT